jgi:hypothetical protein
MDGVPVQGAGVCRRLGELAVTAEHSAAKLAFSPQVPTIDLGFRQCLLKFRGPAFGDRAS